MDFYRKLLVTALVAATWVSPAAAGPTNGPLVIQVFSDIFPAPGSNTIPVAKFDPSNGTLQSVTITYALGFHLTVTYDSNNSPGDSNAGVSATISNGSTTLTNEAGATLADVSGQGDTTFLGIPPFSTGPIEVIVQTDFVTLDALTDPASLAAFTGTGNYNFLAVSSASQSSETDADYVVLSNPILTAINSLQVDYTFSETVADVPEPASLLLLAGGLMATVRRRRAC